MDFPAVPPPPGVLVVPPPPPLPVPPPPAAKRAPGRPPLSAAEKARREAERAAKTKGLTLGELAPRRVNRGRPKNSVRAAEKVEPNAVERVFQASAVEIAEVCVLTAKAGSPEAQRTIIDRISPKRDARFTLVDCPEIETVNDLPRFHLWLLAQLVNGHIAPSEASAIAAVAQHYCESVEAIELEKRLIAVEDRIAESAKFSRRL
jgi:hypothetical protein